MLVLRGEDGELFFLRDDSDWLAREYASTGLPPSLIEGSQPLQT